MAGGLANDGDRRALPGLRPWEAVAGGVLPLALLAAAGCGGETEAVRYRATAAVVVDGKLYEGSTVRETRFTSTPDSLSGFEASVKDIGEAVRVDVGAGRSAVYVLLNGASGSREFPFIVWRCFAIDSGNDPRWIDKLRAVSRGASCKLDAGQLRGIAPLVVAFADEAVPKSIFELTPGSFRAVFGVDATFMQLALERVDDATPVDRQLDKHLPWLDQIPFDGSNIRVLDPSGDRNVLRDQFTLAQKVTDYYFRD